MLSLTITTNTINSTPNASAFDRGSNGQGGFGTSSTNGFDGFGGPEEFREESVDFRQRQDRETLITQDVPVRVLAPASVEGLHEPRCREPDVHITLPPLLQLKSISDRFTKLALTTKAQNARSGFTSSAAGPKLELSGNMHGCLRLALKTDSMNIASTWTGLENPELDAEQTPEGHEGVANHPSTRMKALGDSQGQSDEGWAKVRVEGRDWGKVLSVGRLGGRVVACQYSQQAV